MEKTILFPGVTLRTVNDHRFKSEYLSVTFICSGELRDRACAALLPNVLSRGCRPYPSEAQLQGALLDLYDASLTCDGYSAGETSLISFRLGVPEDRFLPGETNVGARAQDLFFSFIFEPLVKNGAFRREYFASEKKNLLDRLKAEKVNKPRYAVGRCLQMLCPDEPIARPVRELRRDLRPITSKRLYEYYLRILKEAPVSIFYHGGRTGQEIAGALKERLTPLFCEKSPYVRDTVSRPKNRPARLSERIAAHQSTLCVGYKFTPGSAFDRCAASLTRELLCNSPVSLIFTNLREKQSLCYSCTEKYYPRKGVYILYAGIDCKNADRVEKTIDEQIDALKRGAFTEEALENGKKTLVNLTRQMKDEPGQLEGWYLRRSFDGFDEDPENTVRQILQLKKEDVMRSAASLVKDSVFLLAAKSRERRSCAK